LTRAQTKSLGNFSEPQMTCRWEPVKGRPSLGFSSRACQVPAVVPIRSKISAVPREIIALCSRNNRPV
jgi:hypothetical protein